MPRYWLISDRNHGGTGTGRNVAGLTYFTSDGQGPLNNIASWQKATPTQFRTLLAAAADAFPALAPSDHENQSHVTILVHGFNVSFASATAFYQNLCGRLFDGPDSLYPRAEVSHHQPTSNQPATQKDHHHEHPWNQ